MSGHSHWATIKGQKAVADAKKGKAFSLVSRQITLAVKEGKSGDPNDNPRLRLALAKAREANMPKDNVKRAIDKGLGVSAAGAAFQEITVEGYGPGGVAIMVSATTDNPNRTKSEIRQIFERHGGSTGEPGSVAYVFIGGAPTFTIPVAVGSDSQVKNMLDLLDEHDDVDSVKHNAVFS